MANLGPHSDPKLTFRRVPTGRLSNGFFNRRSTAPETLPTGSRSWPPLPSRVGFEEVEASRLDVVDLEPLPARGVFSELFEWAPKAPQPRSAGFIACW